MTKLNIPDWLSVALGSVAGVLEYLNQATFHLGAPWTGLITYGLFVLAVFGVSPLVHNAFRNALHLSPQLATLIAAALSAIAAAVTKVHGQTLRGVLEAIITFAGYVGFGATSGPPSA